MRIFMQTVPNADQKPRFYQLILHQDLLGGWDPDSPMGRLWHPRDLAARAFRFARSRAIGPGQGTRSANQPRVSGHVCARGWLTALFLLGCGIASAQDDFVEPDEYVCVPSGERGWTCGRGRTPTVESDQQETPPATSSAAPSHRPPRPQERSFPTGPSVQPLPAPEPAQAQALDRSILDGETDAERIEDSPAESVTTRTCGDRSPVTNRTDAIGAHSTTAREQQARVDRGDQPSRPDRDQRAPAGREQTCASASYCGRCQRRVVDPDRGLDVAGKCCGGAG